MENIGHEIESGIKEFILAGKADFTIRNEASGGRYTYRVRAPMKETEKGGLKTDHEAKVRFVKVLTGPENGSDYTFVGTIFIDNGGFRWSPKSRVGRDAKSVKAFEWLWARLQNPEPMATVKVYHEGKCGRCGRKLTVPESILSGFGPECRGHAGTPVAA